jgi:multidrug resistance efflux pump
MTWGNRLRLIAGIVAIVLIVGVATVVLSQRKGETSSNTASIEAVAFPVGTDYAGTIIEQPIVKGDVIAAGDPIATIDSSILRESQAKGTVTASSAVFDVHDDGTVTVKSTVAGVVQNIAIQQGGYAGSGSTIATIQATDSLFVTAAFTLDPKDFARVHNGALVSLKLPNSDRVNGEVAQVDVTTVDGNARAMIKVTSPNLAYGGHGGLVAPGTPVEATLTLRNDDPLATAVDALKGSAEDFVGTLSR